MPCIERILSFGIRGREYGVTSKTLKLLQKIQNSTKPKYILTDSSDYIIQSHKKNFLYFEQKDIGLGKINDGIISVNRNNANYIVSIQITYQWCQLNTISKFNLLLKVNDDLYNFTVGWDSFSNKMNVFYKQISLNISKNDKIQFEITNKNIPLMILNTIITFEEY